MLINPRRHLHHPCDLARTVKSKLGRFVPRNVPQIVDLLQWNDWLISQRLKGSSRLEQLEKLQCLARLNISNNGRVPNNDDDAITVNHVVEGCYTSAARHRQPNAWAMLHSQTVAGKLSLTMSCISDVWKDDEIAQAHLESLCQRLVYMSLLLLSSSSSN